MAKKLYAFLKCVWKNYVKYPRDMTDIHSFHFKFFHSGKLFLQFARTTWSTTEQIQSSARSASVGCLTTTRIGSRSVNRCESFGRTDQIINDCTGLHSRLDILRLSMECERGLLVVSLMYPPVRRYIIRFFNQDLCTCRTAQMFTLKNKVLIIRVAIRETGGSKHRKSTTFNLLV